MFLSEEYGTLSEVSELSSFSSSIGCLDGSFLGGSSSLVSCFGGGLLGVSGFSEYFVQEVSRVDCLPLLFPDWLDWALTGVLLLLLAGDLLRGLLEAIGFLVGFSSSSSSLSSSYRLSSNPRSLLNLTLN